MLGLKKAEAGDDLVVKRKKGKKRKPNRGGKKGKEAASS
jgi:hypothetical protein